MLLTITIAGILFSVDASLVDFRGRFMNVNIGCPGKYTTPESLPIRHASEMLVLETFSPLEENYQQC